MAEYLEAPQVETVAQKVLSDHSERAVLDDCEGANIKYLFKVADKSKHWGQCNRATGKWSFLTGFDFVIEIFKSAWDNLSDRQQEALVYHELRHIKKRLVEKDGEMLVKWSTYDHELQFFFDELSFYGAWHGQYEELVNICQGIAQE